LKKFMSAFVFHMSRRVQSHQCSCKDVTHGLTP
jgi:hypothetical protein